MGRKLYTTAVESMFSVPHLEPHARHHAPVPTGRSRQGSPAGDDGCSRMPCVLHHGISVLESREAREAAEAAVVDAVRLMRSCRLAATGCSPCGWPTTGMGLQSDTGTQRFRRCLVRGRYTYLVPGPEVQSEHEMTTTRFSVPELVYVPEPCGAHEVLEIMVGRARRALAFRGYIAAMRSPGIGRLAAGLRLQVQRPRVATGDSRLAVRRRGSSVGGSCDAGSGGGFGVGWVAAQVSASRYQSHWRARGRLVVRPQGAGRCEA